MASLGRKLRTAVRMRHADRLLVAEAVVALATARLRSLLPFRILARQLGELVPPPAGAPSASPLSDAQQRAVRSIRWSIGAVAPWMPFRAVCLQQAIAARAMLDRRGIHSVLHLGVDGSGGTGLSAHAWLDASGIGVTGYPVDPGFAEVGRFV